ncbi:MAG: hypothetical protein IJU40_07375, partial [Desulfovibrionaceae bacterium]|nr:hypothetical protein [Desulfovibrionaceae bacterium]
RLEIGVGLFLILLGLACILLNQGGSLNYIPNCMVGISVLLLGFAFVLSAYWRLSCLRQEKFLPFIKWIKKGGKF